MMLTASASEGKEKDDLQYINDDTRNMEWWHLAAAIFMGIQTIVINIRPVDANIPYSVGYPNRDNNNGPRANVNVRQIGDTDVQGLIVAFLALAAADHLITFLVGIFAKDTFKKWVLVYSANPLRWIEYSASAAVMTVLIAALSGVYDVHLQYLIGIGTSICQLLGMAIEFLPKSLVVPKGSKYSTEHHIDGLSIPMGYTLNEITRMVAILLYTIATISLSAGWVVIVMYFSIASPPDFVYAAFVGTIIAYSTFAINMLLERFFGLYDFVRAEKIYIILSFTAKTFLAWDVYGGFKAAED